MRIVDVDAHLHEPLDWVVQTDPGLATELGPPARFLDIAPSVFGFRDASFASLPEEQQPKERWDLVPPGFVRHLEMTDERQPASHDPSKQDPFYGADGRLRFCDERGIDVQFLNPTFLVGAFVQAGRARRPDLLLRIRAAWNRWAMAQVDGHTERLIPVTQIDLGDVEWSIREMTRMREAGSRAFVLPEAPVASGSERSDSGHRLARSITHPDFEPIWDAAEDLGMAAFAHVGFARERINPGWANNGRESLLTFNMLNFIGNQMGPQLLLAAMVFDGIFERHPNLTVVVEEVGIDWLPHLVAALDGSIGHKPDVLVDNEYRPSHLVMGETYTLPLGPVDYLRRQVRVTPLPAANPLEPVLRQIPPELLCFSSDYPHVEGASDAVTLCERQLAGFSDEVRAGFFGGVGDLLGV
jgi:predicted TIM-barrel fold metal-dependent hydrolase